MAMGDRVRRWFVASMFTLTATCVLLPMTGPGQTEIASPYTPPRTADGHPDLQGIWQVLNTAAWDLEDHGASLGVPAGQSVVEGGTIPYRESALEKRQANFEQRATLDPENRCYLPGVPRITYMPYPFQIIQQADKVSIAYEYLRVVRLYPHERQSASPRTHRLVDGGFPRSLGGRYPGGGCDPLQRQDVVRPGGELPQRSPARGRTLHTRRARITCSMKPPSRIRTSSRGRGRSACRSTGARNRTSSCWNISATRTSSNRNGIIRNPFFSISTEWTGTELETNRHSERIVE